MGGGVILDQGCYTTSMSLLVASLINNLDITNFKLKDIQTDYLDSEIDVHSYAKIDFDNKFISDITVSFRDDIGKKTVILGENGKIILENNWNSEQSRIKVVGKINKTFDFQDTKNLYSLEIENISKNISDNKTEASFPGINKKEILLNSKMISNWMNER